MLTHGNMPGEKGEDGWNKAKINNSEWEYVFFDRSQPTEGGEPDLRGTGAGCWREYPKWDKNDPYGYLLP